MDNEEKKVNVDTGEKEVNAETGEKKPKKGVKILKKVLLIVGIVLGAIVLLLAGLLAFLAITEYKPADKEAVEIVGEADKPLKTGETITVMTWNLGYGALGDNADFFMDGGTHVYTADKDRVKSNLDGMLDQIKKVSPDLLLLQEIDKNSDRSYHINELEMFREAFPGYDSDFAYNFKVEFMPIPGVPPMGKVDSGISTFSAYNISEAERIQLPVPFKWPVRMMNLKRCIIINRIPVDGSDKELVLVDLHLEAYDSGEGKAAQTEMLRTILEDEYKKGNYVIAGGDFNQIFSTEDSSLYPLQPGMWQCGEIDVGGFSDGWQFIMDEKTPSCRSLDKPLEGADQESFQFYLIDGFIVSKNISVESAETLDLGFVCTDHNPVVMKITLSE